MVDQGFHFAGDGEFIEHFQLLGVFILKVDILLLSSWNGLHCYVLFNVSQIFNSDALQNDLSLSDGLNFRYDFAYFGDLGGGCCDERCGDDIDESERTSDGLVLHNGYRLMIDHLYHVIFGVFDGGHLDHFALLPHNYGLLLVNTVRSALDEDRLCLLNFW